MAQIQYMQNPSKKGNAGEEEKNLYIYNNAPINQVPSLWRVESWLYEISPFLVRAKALQEQTPMNEIYHALF